MGKRILHDHIELPINSVKKFFINRANKYVHDNPYISILYQDNDHELALSRDIHEKNKIMPLLEVNADTKILDVGCGIGRWADPFLQKNIHCYVGIDFCEELIEKANSRIQESNYLFYTLPAQNIAEIDSNHQAPFNLVIISGLFLYMNDDEVISFFSGLKSKLQPNATLYIREPLAIEDRLTLNGYWSEELQHEYFSIYRTRDEFIQLIEQGLNIDSTGYIKFKSLYEDTSLNNRKTTQQFYTILDMAEQL